MATKKTRELTNKDFEWVSWSPKEILSKVPRAIEELKADYEKIKSIPKDKRNKENTFYAMEQAGAKGGMDMNFVSFLSEVHPDKEIRDTAHLASEEYARLAVDVEYDPGLYRALKEFVSVTPKSNLTEEEKKMLKEALIGYKRMGFDLPEDKRERLKKNMKELSKLAIAFHKNINDYRDSIVLNKKDSVGLPESFLSRLKKDGAGNFIVSLDYPDVGPFMEFSPNDKKRKELADKNLKKGGAKNEKILKRILELRHQSAKILGYKTHAHFAMELKMAKKPETAIKFVNDIIKKAKPLLKKEMEEILKLKKEITKDKKTEITYFDGYYFSEHKRRTLSLNSEEVRKYFPFDRVKGGVFDMYSKLFSVSFKKVEGFNLWHKEVELYAVHNKGGGVLSYFLIDLFPREGKYNHAAAFDLLNGKLSYVSKDKYEPPLTALVCNFPKPVGGKESLLSHDEVETFFHEFGHVMHQSLYRGRFGSQTGFHVAWDFVEAMSQMLENWVWDEKLIKQMSAHCETGQPIPDDMLKNLISSKKHLIGYWSIRQMVLATFDLEIHAKVFRGSFGKLYSSLVKKNTGIKVPETNMFAAGFGHLLGYDAGYYGYMWSRVFAQDMFSRFEKEGLLNPKTGMDYRKKILEPGSSRDEMKMVVDFLGRKPNNKAFLRDIGIK